MLEMPDVQVTTKGNRVLFVIADRVRISFKKLDRRLRPRNYPTQLALDFLHQQLDPPLPGLATVSSLTNIVAGYTANADETDFEVHITCPRGDRNEWELKLSGQEMPELFSIEPTAATDEQPLRRRVRIRPGIERARDANGSGG